jgi:SAM-dependent methyltransferase
MGFVKSDWDALTSLVSDTLRRSRLDDTNGSLPICLDVGGGVGPLRDVVTDHGFHYVNLDICYSPGVDIVADAHNLPFADHSVDMVISTNSLEHVVNAWTVVKEIVRVMKLGAHLIVLIPFLHPFHGDDVARFTAYGLRKLLAPLIIERIETPSHIFTSSLGILIGVVFWKLRLPGISDLARNYLSLGDRWLSRIGLRFESWAHSYLVLASKQEQT